MKFYFLYILLFIVSIKSSIVVSFAQKDYTNYYQNLRNASEKPDSSMFFYQQAFLCNDPFPEDLISYSRMCFTQGNLDESKKAMEDAIKVGFQYFPGLEEELNIIVDYTFYTRDTLSNFGKFVYENMVEIYDSIRSIFISQCKETDSDIYQALLIYEYYFQKARMPIIDNRTISMKSKTFFVNQLQKPYFDFVLYLLKSNTFPERRKTKHFSSWNFTMILNHIGLDEKFISKEDKIIFFDLLWKQVLKGNIHPFQYCLLYDQRMEGFDKPSVFGTNTIIYSKLDKEGYKGQIIELKHPEKVDKLRAEHFLPSLASFANNYEYKLPKNYVQ